MSAEALGLGIRPSGSNAWRFAPLLAAIVAAFLIQGIATPGRWEQLIVTVLLGATLLLALRVADSAPVVMRWVAVAVAAAVALSVVEALAGNVDPASTRIVSALLVAVAPPSIVLGTVRGLRATQSVTIEAVTAVLCVYLLLGMFFANLYGAIDRLGGAPFFAQQEPATVARCIYFSFTTLATLGYGDLTARSNLGHTLSVSEALLGQLYLVTVVSLIVANLGRRRGAPPPAELRSAPTGAAADPGPGTGSPPSHAG
ncbi:MAG: potassium channel family protein [Solirubrobacteraceae bacterium]